ncbi:hypothetical protein TCAL_06427 [Tigriopus californicus]|uniref:Ion transport domain-containing protein n=1 Tax=Tigriopus californicus TaxID=6832 RepID=A0A553NQ25_TIGCA|nr:transient receptor potential cation channel subfamily A member 1 homolog [Tigriopus californicus]TRY67514.1 hypothetical protein TCAL_06427 [Tigriopus californicus]|eukprot:TCALIF_06427-PA protein Name:"Similar to trpa-1 Transient receptor potential cation channel subfamily A member 1 homolog (Caenorhabditis elegans)" AED:0.06 eAED:0.06 QI:251/1/1/1/0.73/0.7/20/1041/1253
MDSQDVRMACSQFEDMDGGNPPELVFSEIRADESEEELQTLAAEGEAENESTEDDGDDDVFGPKPKKSGFDNLPLPGDEGVFDIRSTTSTTPDPIPKSLHQIARDNDIDNLKAQIDTFRKELEHRVNDLDEKRLSPLHYAARYSHYEMIQLLLDLKADINRYGDDETTPLQYAARYAKKASNQALSAFDNRKVSVISTSGSSSPLLSRDNPDGEKLNTTEQTVNLLIENGANVNAVDKYKLTALHHAAIRGNETAIQCLLEAKDIEREPRDIQDSTPLHLAATYNNYNVAQLLLRKKANPRSYDKDRRTPLHEACLEGHFSIARLILNESEREFGQNYVSNIMRDKDDEGSTPLLLAVGSGRAEIVKMLMQRNDNVNTRNKMLVCPVHSAARTGDLEILKILVKNNAHLNVRNALQQTPLFLAAATNNLDVIDYLVESGASINLWDQEGVTPMAVACIEGHLEAVKLLLNHGARLDILDKDDKSILYHAAEKNHPEIIQLILKNHRGTELMFLNDQSDNLPIHAACAKGNLDCVLLLGDLGADIDNKNEDEQTPLHLAAINGHFKVVELIVKKDRNSVMDEDEDSNTALHLACTSKRAKCVEILLNNGADVQNRNAKKWTALDCAASVGAIHCAKLLLQYDSPIDPMDRNKTTPLHLAAQNGHNKMILLLLRSGADIAKEDAYGRNMLELAILSRKRNVVKTVLGHKDWRKALRTTFTVTDRHGTKVPDTPLRMLIRVYPDLAEMVFNQCITVERPKSLENSRSTTLVKSLPWISGSNVKFDYEFIDDAFYLSEVPADEESGRTIFKYSFVDDKNKVKRLEEPYASNGKVWMDNHPLMIMAQQRRRDLLRHPLCLALVRHKWKTFGRYMYYGNLTIYSLFLTFLTIYILVAPNPAVYGSTETKNRCFQTALAASRENPDWTKKSIENICQYGIMTLVGINLILEILEFYRARSRYFSWKNMFDWLVYVMAFLLVFDIKANAPYTGERECWQWEMGAITVVLAWLNLLGDVRQLPFLGIYVIMFFDILRTFFKFAVIFLLFIIAFGLGFHTLILTTSEGPFSDIGYAFVKTAVMMVGEFEFDTLFFPPPEEGNELPFPVTTILLFVAFLIVMSIILMNLMVGLAVDDIKAVQEQAILKRLAMQVELVLDVERLLPNVFLRKGTTQRETIHRKKRHWWSIFTDVVSSRSIIKDVTGYRNIVDIQDVLDKQDAMDDAMGSLKSEMRSIAEENSKMKEILISLAERSGISVQDDSEN